MTYHGVFVAKNVEEINKYEPGVCKFVIPQLMSSNTSEVPTVTKITNTNANLSNKDKSQIEASYTEVSSYIEIAVPIEHTIYHAGKIIPKGTVFWVMFVGGDINKPIIIGRDINGYYSEVG